MSRLLGAVLAGGDGRRFGSDKALACIGETTLLDHAIASLRPSVAAIIVVGRKVVQHVSIADWPTPGLGPLGGLCGALRYGEQEGFSAVVSTACDIPFLPERLLGGLIEAQHACYITQTPVIGFWPCSLAADLSTWLELGGDRSVRGWAAGVGATPIYTDKCVANINYREDLDRLRMDGRDAR